MRYIHHSLYRFGGPPYIIDRIWREAPETISVKFQWFLQQNRRYLWFGVTAAQLRGWESSGWSAFPCFEKRKSGSGSNRPSLQAIPVLKKHALSYGFHCFSPLGLGASKSGILRCNGSIPLVGNLRLRWKLQFRQAWWVLNFLAQCY